MLISRFKQLQSDVWTSLRRGAQREFRTKLTESLSIATNALTTGGLAEYEVGAGEGEVRLEVSRTVHELMDLVDFRRQFSLDAAVSKHPLFKAEPATDGGEAADGVASGHVVRCAMHPELKLFGEIVRDVAVLCADLFDLVECAILQSSSGLRDLHRDKHYRLEDGQRFMAFPSRLRIVGHRWASSDPAFDGFDQHYPQLSVLVKAVSPIIEAEHKKTYAAVNILIGLFIQGKPMVNVDAIIKSFPVVEGPLAEFFHFSKLVCR